MNKRRKNVTIEQIANRVGVCKSTVSKALSNATDVNEQTRVKIISTAAELGYTVRRNAEKHKNSVSVYVYNINSSTVNRFANELILGFQTAASESNFSVNVVNISSLELSTGSYCDNLTYSKSKGYFFIGFPPHERFIDAAERKSIPFVIFEDYVNSALAVEIGYDNSICYKILINHLVRLGHRKIAFLGGEQTSRITSSREIAFINAMTDNNLRVYRKMFAYGSYFGTFNKSDIIDLIDNGATAIVCASDGLANETVKACQSVGLRVPTDVSITGFDGLAFTKYTNPPLTTIFQNRIQIGKSAFHLIQQINSGVRLTKLSFRAELIARESTSEHIEK